MFYLFFAQFLNNFFEPKQVSLYLSASRFHSPAFYAVGKSRSLNLLILVLLMFVFVKWSFVHFQIYISGSIFLRLPLDTLILSFRDMLNIVCVMTDVGMPDFNFELFHPQAFVFLFIGEKLDFEIGSPPFSSFYIQWKCALCNGVSIRL